MNKNRALTFSILIIIILFSLGSCGGGESNGDRNADIQVAEDTAKVTITGTVLDDDGNPVANAQVTISSDPVTVFTDSNGYFSVEVEIGDHEIEIVKDDIVIHTGTFSCNAGIAFSHGNIATSHHHDPDDPVSVPSAPENLSASAGDGQVVISWDSVSGASNYNIYMSTASGVSVSNYDGTFNSDSASYTWKGLTNLEIYYFVVTALNQNGESEESDETSETLLSYKKLLPPDIDETVDLFGWSVGISGDYAIVGAYAKEDINDRGAVYIFHRTGPDEWDSGMKIKAGSWIGATVAIDGDYAVACGRGDSAFIFQRTGPDTWDSGTEIIATGPAKNSGIGNSLAISEDYVIMGATQSVEKVPGAAYIYRRTGPNTWSSGTMISPADAEYFDSFGVSVSISGDYAIVGAAGDDEIDTNAGAAYIYKRTALNSWESETKITAPDAEENDRFGVAVSIDGDYAVIGARDKDKEGKIRSGAVYVFQRTSSNSWESVYKITIPITEPGGFGRSVAINGYDVIVGGWNSAYIYKKNGLDSWDSGKKLSVPNSLSFGQSVSISNGTAIVGDAANGIHAADGSTPDTAYIFLNGP